jgi:hypothetical protein
MCVRTYQKHSCGCRGREIEHRPCKYYTREHSSLGEFSHGMHEYRCRLNYLRDKCAQKSRVVEVPGGGRCPQCQSAYDDLVRSILQEKMNEGKGN